MALYQYIARRILLAVPVLIFVSIFVFSVVHLAPGDPVRMMVNPKMGQEVIQAVREKLGLDRPLHIQYLLFMKRILMGDLGRSLYTRQKISSMILQRLPNTIILMMAGLLLSYLSAVPLGILAATHRGSPLDYMSMSIALVGIAMPQFWLGLLLILAFSISLGWFPVAGYGDFKHLVLPAITLAASVMALVARVMRSSMLEFLSKDFITTARAKGLLEPIIVYKHALRNALNPVIALFGLDFGWMLGGAVMVEYIFNRPGLGRLMVESIYMRDYPVVQVLILVLAASVILGNITGDILLSIVNPKIRYK